SPRARSVRLCVLRRSRRSKARSCVLWPQVAIVDAMVSLTAEQWAKARTFHHSNYPVARIAAERRQSVSVCLPARECAGTAGVAERAGAKVVQERELMGEIGPVLGKGDAMWRALSVLEGELIVFLDA